MANRPKVLHLWNSGRVAAILAREYPDSLVLISGRQLDPFRTGEDPHHVFYCGSTEGMADAALRAVPNFDIVHVHSLSWLVPRIRKCHPEAKIVLHHHGQNLREGSQDMELHACQLADAVLFSTPDLGVYLPRGASYLPNPIDERLFKRCEYPGKGDLFPLCYERQRPYLLEVQAALPNVTVWIRWRDPMPYWEMPSFLSGFEREISWKPEVNYSATPEKVLTLTDLECLMLGKQVYYWPTKETLTEFPEAHRTENVLAQLDAVYGELLR